MISRIKPADLKPRVDNFNSVVEKLANDTPLDDENRDHKLTNSKYYKEMRECHIDPDWLLIYKKGDKNNLILTLIRTGTHSDLY